MAKKLLSVSIFVLALSFGLAALAFPCKEGNMTFLPSDDPENLEGAWCCVPVGDGSELSSTDGDIWFNVPNIDTID